MTKEEQARLLEAASHCLAAAAQVKLGPEATAYMAEELTRSGRSLAAFAVDGAAR